MKKDFQPEQKPNNEPLPIDSTSSPNCTKPDVICSQSPLMSLDDAIFLLEVKYKVSDLNVFLDFIIYCLKNVKGFYEWFDKKYKSKQFSICVKVGEGFYLDLEQIRNMYLKLSPNKSGLSRAVDFVKKYS